MIAPTTTGPLWPLELDAEAAPSAPGISAPRAGVLAELIARVPGVERVSAVPHCAERFVLVRMTIAAPDLSDAVDLACAALHRCAGAAGLGALVLVAVRCAR